MGGTLSRIGVFLMNAKLMTVALLAVVVVGGGLFALAADDSAADIDIDGDYPIDHPGQVNMSNLFVVLCAIFIIGAVIIVGLALHVKLYGDF